MRVGGGVTFDRGRKLGVPAHAFRVLCLQPAAKHARTHTKHAHPTPSRVALGFVTGLDYQNPYLSPYQVGGGHI